MTTLESIISDIESAGNRFAMRFEPHVFARTGEGKYGVMVSLAKERNKCSFDTARVIVSMSYGAYQIMGFNLYDPHVIDYPKSVGAFLSDDMVQAGTFRAFCQRRNIYFPVKDLYDESVRLRFAEVYNGPATPHAYAKKIASRLPAVS